MTCDGCNKRRQAMVGNRVNNMAAMPGFRGNMAARNPGIRSGVASGITRGQFLRTAGVGAAAVGAASMGFGGMARANGVTPPNSDIEWDAANNRWIVYPTGSADVAGGNPYDGLDMTQDALNIQWVALPASMGGGDGGNILLKSTNRSGAFTPFNFGDVFRDTAFIVYIEIPCIISGEARADRYSDTSDPLYGKPRMTEIANGCANFSVNWWTNDASMVQFRNIVSRNVNTGFAAVYGYCDFLADGVKMIGVKTSWDGFMRLPIWSHQAGRYTVRNCLIYDDPADPPALLHCGFVYAGGPVWTWDGTADVEMSNNDVRLNSAPLGSIALYVEATGFNFENPLSPAPKAVNITGNSIVADVGIAASENYSYVNISGNPGPNGKFVARNVGIMASNPEGFLDYNTWEWVNVPWSQFGAIKNNRIELNPEGTSDFLHPFSGIMGMNNSTWTIFFFSLGAADLPPMSLNGADVSGNKLSGMADSVVWMEGVPLFSLFGPEFEWVPNTGYGNVFKGDNYSTLQLPPFPPSGYGATYIFGPETHNNVVAGHTGGAGAVATGNPTNTFTGQGFTGLGPEAARLIVDANKMAQQAMQALRAKAPASRDPKKLFWAK